MPAGTSERADGGVTGDDGLKGVQHVPGICGQNAFQTEMHGKREDGVCVCVCAVKEPFVSSDVRSIKNMAACFWDPPQDAEEQTVLANRAAVTFCWSWVGDASVCVWR